MLHQEFASPEQLSGSIRCFWYDKREFGASTTSFEVLPDGYAEIIFHFGSGCSMLVDEVLQPLPSPFIMGLLNQPVIFYTKDRLEIIGVRCFPWTVFDLLGLSAAKHALHIIEHPMARLQEPLSRCLKTGNIEEAIAILRRYFEEAHAKLPADSMLFKAGVAMRDANGAIPVSEVAAAAHATVRTLERNFKQSSGHTVKDVTALMRFEQVRNRLWTEPDTNLAGLAQELGYTDQSHLSKEFKRYTGTTPAAFARKTKQSKKILPGELTAFR
jgi:AraC-like DNA-binding protein